MFRSPVAGLGRGVAAWLQSPNSASLASAVTDETGSGALVFGTAPTITGIIGGKASFSAHKNGTDQTGIASITQTKVTFGTEVFDTGSYYDAVNSKWTPPAGRVVMEATLLIADTATSGYYICSIYKNGSQYKSNVSNFAINAVPTTAINCMIVDDANGTDYYEAYVYLTTGSTGTINGLSYQSYFTGSYLGA